MSNAKGDIDAGNALRARNSLGIKVFRVCAELRGEKVGRGKSVGPGKVCRLTGQFLMTNRRIDGMRDGGRASESPKQERLPPSSAIGDILKTLLENISEGYILPATGVRMFQEIKASLRQLYLEDERPWLVGFSGGKSLS
jgi:hypothetical protein